MPKVTVFIALRFLGDRSSRIDQRIENERCKNIHLARDVTVLEETTTPRTACNATHQDGKILSVSVTLLLILTPKMRDRFGMETVGSSKSKILISNFEI
jgi:hypothetical protein